MGGQEAIRGFLVQSIIGVLKALSDNSIWESLTLEPNLETEKVDLLLLTKTESLAFQIKSTKNEFSLHQVETWAKTFYTQFNSATQHTLILIGCLKEDLKGISKIGSVIIENPNELDLPKMEGEASELLKKFVLEHHGENFNTEFCNFALDALIKKLMSYSTTGTPISRSNFIDLLGNWIEYAYQQFLPNPFIDFDEFFRNFIDPSRIFNHIDSLVGRGEYLSEFTGFLSNPSRILILSGRGGIGKTKVLYESLKNVIGSRIFLFVRDLEVRIVENHKRYIGEKSVIIVDDAHLRTSFDDVLRLLSERADVKVIFSLRPQGVKYLKHQILNSGFSASDFKELREMQELPLEEKLLLAKNVSGVTNDVTLHWICDFAKDSTLILVMSAFLVKQAKIHPSDAKSKQEFADLVLSRFLDIGTDQVFHEWSFTFGQEKVKDILFRIAAIEPFHYTDESLNEKFASNLAISAEDYQKLIFRLKEIGILYNKGFLMRITPDVLSDYLLKEYLLGRRDTTQKSIAGLLELFPEYENNILRNIAQLELEFIQSQRGKSLLDPLFVEWEKIFIDGDITQKLTILEKISVIAHFKPDSGLKFARLCLSSKKHDEETNKDNPFSPHTEDLLRHCCHILKEITYLDLLYSVIELLWNIGKRLDKKRIYPEYDHPFAILKTLAEYEPYKPLEVSKLVLNFLERQIEVEGEIKFKVSLLDIFAVFFIKEGHSARSFSPGTVSIGYFVITPDKVTELRDHTLTQLEKSLVSDNITLIWKAYEILIKDLDLVHPIGPDQSFEQINANWLPERLKTIQVILDSLSEQSAVIQLKVISKLQMIMEHQPIPSESAQHLTELFHNIAGNFKYRLVEAISGVYLFENLPDRIHFELREVAIKEKIANFIPEFESRNPLQAQINIFSKIIKDFKEIDGDDFERNDFNKFFVQYGQLHLKELGQICIEIVKNIPELKIALRDFLYLLKQHDFLIFSKIVKVIIRIKKEDLLGEIVQSYFRSLRFISISDKEILVKLIRQNFPVVKALFVELLHKLKQINNTLFLQIFFKIKFTCLDNDKTIDDYASIFAFQDYVSFLNRKQMKLLLRKMSTIKSLSENMYFANQLIASCFRHIPNETLRFAYRRISYSKNTPHYQDFPHTSIPHQNFYSNLSNSEEILKKILKKFIWKVKIYDIWNSRKIKHEIYDPKMLERQKIRKKDILKTQFYLWRLPNFFTLIANRGESQVACNLLKEWFLSRDYKKIYASSEIIKKFPGHFLVHYHFWISDILEKSVLKCSQFHRYIFHTFQDISEDILLQSTRTYGTPDAKHTRFRDDILILKECYEKQNKSITARFWEQLSERTNRTIEDNLVRDESEEI